MKSRQEHIDFDRNYCTHYAPKPGAALKDDYCALGCGASAMMKKAREMGGQPRMAPCIGGHECADVHAICPKWERRSLEHAEARADSIEESMRRMTIVGPVVSAWRKRSSSARPARDGCTSASRLTTATCTVDALRLTACRGWNEQS